ncbi:hypothetical protein JWJ90_12270 [Desulfobulbus rhabdoformis]|uniref:hypothetical protein n=1 Tax=Desulfobulbus rhabdoformis TaxID=34032 RepID=UPI001962E5DF|nr:hypothetical protein [Desulfobulbus rhabdoformis]MBM9615054.1 hypothetical protein [Desulfobulbus rhabdoformis]
MEQVIFNGKTAEHPVLITDEDSLRSLRFGTEERQSCLDLDAPHILQLAYTQWMTTALFLHPQPSRFLVVGLGGAALPHFLLHHFPACELTIVEKQRLVIDLAHGYFRLPLKPEQIRLCHQDALHFGRNEPPGDYHTAFLDIYGAGAMAPALFDPLFYRLLLEQLEGQGTLAINLWSGNRRLFQQALEAIHEASDGQMLSMQVKKRSNAIVLAFPGQIPHKAIKRARKQSTGLQQAYGIDYPLFFKRLRRTNRIPILSTLFAHA